MTELADAVIKGNRRVLARLLTMIENESEGADESLAALFPHTGNAWIIGVTGAPGTGKSSLVNALAKAYRTEGKTVGIIAVDPTSPFSGGALLGDRIRMRDLSGDTGVFIRSMATRGSLGGIAKATRDAIRVMDAAGFDVVLVETVGAGQSEVDIVRTAQTTIVVEAPGLGDDVQAIKAGILEIADILVVNKADHPGTSNTVRFLRSMLELGHPVSRTQFTAHHGRIIEDENSPANHDLPVWIPPVLQTIAINDEGIAELMEAIAAHRAYLQENDMLGRLERQHVQLELYDRLQTALMSRLLEDISEETLSEVISRIQARKLDPHQAVQTLLQMQAAVRD